MTLFLVFIVFAVVTLIIWTWRRRHLYRLSLKINGPFALPLIGNALMTLFKSENDVFAKIYEDIETYGSPYRLWLGPKLMLVVTEPEQLKIILNSQNTLDKSSMYDEVKYIFGSSIGTSKAEKWRRLRKLNKSVFAHGAVESYLPNFNRYSKLLMEKLHEKINGPIDFYVVLGDVLIQSACEIFLGDNMEELSGGNYLANVAKIAPLIMKKVVKLYFHIPLVFYFSKYSFQFINAGLKVLQFNSKLLRKKKEMHQGKNRVDKQGAFDFLLDSSNFSQEDYDELVKTMIISEKVFREFETAQSAFSCVEITVEKVAELEYLEKVIMESLRFFPALPFLGRLVTKDFMLGALKVPKNTEILIPVVAIHRSPTYWENPLNFNPERFSPEKVAHRHPYSYLGFSAGIRNCIGKRYAIVSSKIILAHIVHGFKITCGYKNIESIEFEPAFFLKPKDGFKVSLERRGA